MYGGSVLYLIPGTEVNTLLAAVITPDTPLLYKWWRQLHTDVTVSPTERTSKCSGGQIPLVPWIRIIIHTPGAPVSNFSVSHTCTPAGSLGHNVILAHSTYLFMIHCNVWKQKRVHSTRCGTFHSFLLLLFRLLGQILEMWCDQVITPSSRGIDFLHWNFGVS